MTSSILDLAGERVVLLDGGMGTELIRRGLPQGSCPELWNAENPGAVKDVHQSYYLAGSDVVSTNSFGGSRIKLALHGLENRCYELNLAAARLAVEIKPAGKFVAGSIGPTGKFLKPQGDFEEEEFEEAFSLQARALTDGGVDFLLLETMYDLREARCALRGAKKTTTLPVLATMTFNLTPRGFFTLMGNPAGGSMKALEEEGAAAVGANCTLGSAEMTTVAAEIRAATFLPVIIQPNAGQPILAADGTVNYTQTVDDFVSYIPRLVENGVRIIGGCCGTNPEYIRRMAEILGPK